MKKHLVKNLIQILKSNKTLDNTNSSVLKKALNIYFGITNCVKHPKLLIRMVMELIFRVITANSNIFI